MIFNSVKFENGNKELNYKLSGEKISIELGKILKKMNYNNSI